MPIRDNMTYEYEGTAGLVVLPTHIIDAINAKLDEEIAKVPEAARDRCYLYQELVNFFSEYGQLADFKLVRREEA